MTLSQCARSYLDHSTLERADHTSPRNVISGDRLPPRHIPEERNLQLLLCEKPQNSNFPYLLFIRITVRTNHSFSCEGWPSRYEVSGGGTCTYSCQRFPTAPFTVIPIIISRYTVITPVPVAARSKA
jgi:hypothetical protein